MSRDVKVNFTLESFMRKREPEVVDLLQFIILPFMSLYELLRMRRVCLKFKKIIKRTKCYHIIDGDVFKKMFHFKEWFCYSAPPMETSFFIKPQKEEGLIFCFLFNVVKIQKINLTNQQISFTHHNVKYNLATEIFTDVFHSFEKLKSEKNGFADEINYGWGEEIEMIPLCGNRKFSIFEYHNTPQHERQLQKLSLNIYTYTEKLYDFNSMHKFTSFFNNIQHLEIVGCDRVTNFDVLLKIIKDQSVKSLMLVGMQYEIHSNNDFFSACKDNMHMLSSLQSFDIYFDDNEQPDWGCVFFENLKVSKITIGDSHCDNIHIINSLIKNKQYRELVLCGFSLYNDTTGSFGSIIRSMTPNLKIIHFEIYVEFLHKKMKQDIEKHFLSINEHCSIEKIILKFSTNNINEDYGCIIRFYEEIVDKCVHVGFMILTIELQNVEEDENKKEIKKFYNQKMASFLKKYDPSHRKLLVLF